MKPSIIGTAQINPLGCRPKTSVPPTDCDFVRTSYPGTTGSFREFLILPSQNSFRFLSQEKGPRQIPIHFDAISSLEFAEAVLYDVG
ncbi:hypothetical protein NPIL_554971 [Nephila pilipes]|uniref:Uncharacterized protein n=1 Tax=Nephila pilipes TaxID=299642 RepID=A0A8X6P865_NEPPI|nr:hypothetical protein NPIL_622151 [Nephila pilipes]GFU27935.1 hypothetical protein NPIL_554971 [Nephila pilipes]